MPIQSLELNAKEFNLLIDNAQDILKNALKPYSSVSIPLEEEHIKLTLDKPIPKCRATLHVGASFTWLTLGIPFYVSEYRDIKIRGVHQLIE